MSSTASSRTFASAFCAFAASWFAGCAIPGEYGPLLFREDFRDLANWHIESEKPGRIEARDGLLDIDVPAGCTLWFKQRLTGPIAIQFEATAVAAGGANDQVSDLNVFWMANNRDGTAPHTRQRSGKFAEYNDLLTYYVGLGGNRNTTTRFRRYIGDPESRPLRPEHDLGAPHLLVPNVPQTVTLIAAGPNIEYRRDGSRIFHLDDTAPYANGWFALRTTYSHLRIRNLRIYRLTNT